MHFSLEPFRSKKSLPSGFLKEVFEAIQTGKVKTADMIAFFTALEIKGYKEKDLQSFLDLFSEKESSNTLVKGTITLSLPQANAEQSFLAFSIALLLATQNVPVLLYEDSSFFKSLGLASNLSDERQQVLFDRCAFVLAPKQPQKSFEKLQKTVKRQLSFPTILERVEPLLSVPDSSLLFRFCDHSSLELMSKQLKKQKRTQSVLLSWKDEKREALEVLDIRKSKLQKASFRARHFGWKQFLQTKSSLNRRQAIKAFQDFLKGELSERHEQQILLMTSIILKQFRGKYSLKKWMQMSQDTLKSGNISELFSQILFLQNISDEHLHFLTKELQKLERKKMPSLKILKKKTPVSTRSFRAVLNADALAAIPEIRASIPGVKKGKLSTKKLEELALELEALGSDALSVWTNKDFSGGSFELLTRIQKQTRSVPLLCKDLFLRAEQIYQARQAGADAITLTASLLSSAQMADFRELSEELGMEVVVEVRNKEELQRALDAQSKVLLLPKNEVLSDKALKKSPHSLLQKIPKNVCVIFEAEYDRQSQLKRLPKRVSAVSVTKTFLTSKKLSNSFQKLFGQQKSQLSVFGIQRPSEALHALRLGAHFLVLDFCKKSPGKISYQQAQKILEAVRKKHPDNTVYGYYDDAKDSELKRDVKALGLDGVVLKGEWKISALKKLPFDALVMIPLQKVSDLKKAQRLLKVCPEVLLNIDPLSEKNKRLEKLIPQNPFPLQVHSSLSARQLSGLLPKGQSLPFLSISLPNEASQKDRKRFLEDIAKSFC